MNVLTPAEILALPMQPNDAKAETVRDYLVALVAEVWELGEEFSGNRPFGNSGWNWELYVPLVKAGVIEGEFNEDDGLEDYDTRAGDALIAEAIKALGVTA